MDTSENIFNVDNALREMEYHYTQEKVSFGPYAPAYIVATQERLNNDMKYMYNKKDKKTCAKVLTVAASGDHPIFCKLYGAENITTFDITYTAKVIMDIKTAAIQEFGLWDYESLIESCWNNKNLMSIKAINKIMPYLDTNTQNYLCAMDGKFPLFIHGLEPFYSYSKLTKKQYKTLQKSVDAPFPFIWSDIANLDAKLGDNTYDFIHLSNIFDYVSNDVQKSVLQQLIKRLNPGGRILMVRINGSYILDDICQEIANASSNLGFVNYINKYLLVRIR